MPSPRLTSALLAIAAVAALSSCGKDEGATTPTSASTPPPVAGTPPPTTTQPTPTPSPTPVTQGSSCARLSVGTGSDSSCRNESSRVYEAALSTAIGSVRGEYMNGNEIVNFSGYRADIITSLDRDGICAAFEGDNLFMRGVGDDFNEYYDVITSRGDRSQRYTNTCRPPVPTPVPPGPPPVRDPSCKLPPSIETICFEDGEQFFGEEVRTAIEQVIADDRARATPIIFNFGEQRGEGGYTILDATRYHDEVVKKLQAMGFCAWYDSEEIQVKNSNLFSAHWDIYKAEGYRIQLFAAICRDAAF